MFDTIKITFNKRQGTTFEQLLDRPKLFKPDFFSCLSYTTKSNCLIFVPPKGSKKFYSDNKLLKRYLPTVGVKGSLQKRSYFEIFIEFSAPKLVHGSSLFDLRQEDGATLIANLIERLNFMGINVTEDEVVNQGIITRFDVARNYYISPDKFFYAKYWFPLLSFVHFDKRKVHNTRNLYFDNDIDDTDDLGFSFSEKLNSKESRVNTLTTYFKSVELINNIKTEKDQEVANYLREHDLESNVLRQEKRREGREEILKPFKDTIPVVRTPHLCDLLAYYELFDSDIVKVFKSWNDIFQFINLDMTMKPNDYPDAYIYDRLMHMGLRGEELSFNFSFIVLARQVGVAKATKLMQKGYGDTNAFNSLRNKVTRKFKHLDLLELHSFNFYQLSQEMYYQLNHC